MYQLLSPQSSTTSTFLSNKNSHSWQQNHFFIIASIRRFINNCSPLQFYHHLSRCIYPLYTPKRNTIGGILQILMQLVSIWLFQHLFSYSSFHFLFDLTLIGLLFVPVPNHSKR
nr:MAG TPA: hypothetical protein [Caudoviricetes sp.]